MLRPRTLIPWLACSLVAIAVDGQLPEFPMTFSEMKVWNKYYWEHERRTSGQIVGGRGTLLLVATRRVFGVLPVHEVFEDNESYPPVIAGYYTEDGKYLGGIPKTDDLSREIYECLSYIDGENATLSSSALFLNSTNSVSMCLEWRADESAGGTFELGVCTCKSLAEGNLYCQAWTCNQVKQYSECDSAGDCYYDSNVDAVLCQCGVVNSSGQYCDSWSCKQLDSKGREKFEYYDCVREAPSGLCCEAWTGNVTSTDEVEVVACQCVAEWNGDTVCSYWECEELRLEFCRAASDGWCRLGMSVGVGGGVGFVGVVTAFVAAYLHALDSNCASWFVAITVANGIVWCAAWAYLVVIWGGQDGAMYVGILWGVPLVCMAIMFCASAPARRNDNTGRNEAQNLLTLTRRNGRWFG